MQLHWIDWFIILGYGVLAFGISLWFSHRASENVSEFFIAGRKLTWWMAGTSIVATTFAADTPLAVSGWIRSGGIYKNWFWWCILLGGMMCVFFYARLWRRAEILTDVAFNELRYDGKPAAALRGFMAVYKGVLYNCIVMGWVILAMSKIVKAIFIDVADKTFQLPIAGTVSFDTALIVGLVLFALCYTLLSGFWGVVMTDLVQFVMAMVGSYALAGIVLWKMGGPSGMVAKVQAAPGFKPEMLTILPSWEAGSEIALFTFVILITIKWWGNGEGSGYIAQRLFSARSERDSVLAALWFNIAHYVLRPWPWIIVGIASIVYFPLASKMDPEMAYPRMMLKFLPIGLKGMMVASLLAAFMSTIDTHLNWGSSYLVNDLYKRFLVKDATDKHYVAVSRWAMVLLTVLAGITTWNMDSIKNAWIYLAVLTSGAALASLLRWFWWRINPWSEISAMMASFVLANGKLWLWCIAKVGINLPTSWLDSLNYFYGKETWALRLLVVVLLSTVVWLTVTFMTQPSSQKHLERFYRRLRPGGWWGPVAKHCPEVTADPMKPQWFSWACGVTCVYAMLFAVGFFCLARPGSGAIALLLSLLSGWGLVSFFPKEQEA